MKPVFSYQLVQDEDVSIVKVSPHPDWDEFDQFVSDFLQQEGGTLVAQDYGMDRHQVRYRVLDKQYILQYEHYSNSIWIETDY